jgi:hypothetical protein
MNTPEQKIVISASRRTDIPAFYADWFMDRIDRGFFEVANPFTGRIAVVPATPDRVHTVVFWSKNFGPFLAAGMGEELVRRGLHLFFNFSLNSTDQRLEPHVPPLAERLRQLEALCRRFDPRAVTWRFDPICFYTTGRGPVCNNLADFETIARRASQLGIQRCVTSFMDRYAKIERRIPRGSGFRFRDPPLDIKHQVLIDMSKTLAERHIGLFTCCEKDVLAGLPPDTNVRAAACVPNDLLKALYGGNLSLLADRGQRRSRGCGCRVSVDIGSYRDQPCYHNCLFCYANPVMDTHHRPARLA